MSIRGKAHVMGVFEHPARDLPDHSVQQIHAECAVGALADAGLSIRDVDGYFSTGQLGFGGVSLTEYLGLNPSYIDATFTGGSSYLAHVGHAAAASTAAPFRRAASQAAGSVKQSFAAGAKSSFAATGAAFFTSQRSTESSRALSSASLMAAWIFIA